MTGREALDKLQAGFTLRRESWEPDEKCKAYFSDGCYFSHQAKEFPKVPSLNPPTPWTNLFNQEIAEELIDDILKEDWEILD